MLTSIICSAALLSCSDEPTTAHRTAAEGLARYEATALPNLSGCSQLLVTIGGLDSIRIAEVARGDCGPIHPELGDVPQFNHITGVVRLPVVLANNGTQAVRAPARAYGWTDSLDVTEPSGLNNPHSAGYVDFQPADSAIAPGAAQFAGALLWRFDTLLAPSGQSQVLAPGARSRVHWIEFKAQGGVHVFRVDLWADARRAGSPVPAVAPESIPRASWDSLIVPANIVPDGQGHTGPFVRNAVYVVFRPEATQGQRQNAIDAIDGEVIGGFYLAGAQGGHYLVRLSNASGAPPDSAWGPVMRAWETLAKLPYVRLASPVYTFGPVPTYIKPVDGVGFTNWTLSPDSVQTTDSNWGLEAIDAPFAWGCSKGTAQTRVSVVDEGVFAPSDLSPNLDAGTEVGLNSNNVSHGTSVASIIGAAGNNHQGITGVLWTARIGAFEASRPVAGSPDPRLLPIFAIDRAVKAGYPIINISMGYYFHKTQNRAPILSDSVAVNAIAEQLKMVIEDANSAGHRALFVISASNDSADAYYSGYGAVARDPAIRNQVVVVGATRLATRGRQALSATSNFGPLVDVVAPGENVSALDATGAVVQFSGASAATPFATGVAGMLLTFDPALTSDSLRALIIRGAVAAGRQVADPSNPVRPLPILNAARALRATAEHPQSALCGNRVWLANNQVIAARGANTEALFNYSTTQSLPYPDVFHGGRRIDIGTTETHIWNPATRSWPQSSPSQSTDSLHSASFFSAYGFAHDLQMSATTQVASQGTSATVTVRVLNRLNNSVLQKTQSFPLVSNLSPACIRKQITELTETTVTYGCIASYDTVYVGTNQRITASTPAMAPQANFTMVAVNLFSESTTWTSNFVPCDGTPTLKFIIYLANGDSVIANQAPTELCANPGSITQTVLRTDVFRVDSASNTWTQVLSLPTMQIGWVGVNERGDEFVLGRSGFNEMTTEKMLDPDLANRQRFQVISHQLTCSDNHVEFRGMTSPSTILNDLILGDTGKCPSDYLSLGDMAPSRVPVGKPIIVPNTASIGRTAPPPLH